MCTVSLDLVVGAGVAGTSRPSGRRTGWIALGKMNNR